MTAYINLIVYTVVTLYQTWPIWRNRHIRQKYARRRVLALWFCLLITGYLAAAYVPIVFGLVGNDFAPMWIRPAVTAGNALTVEAFEALVDVASGQVIDVSETRPR